MVQRPISLKSRLIKERRKLVHARLKPTKLLRKEEDGLCRKRLELEIASLSRLVDDLTERVNQLDEF